MDSPVLSTAFTTHEAPPIPKGHDEIRIVRSRLGYVFDILPRRWTQAKYQCGHTDQRFYRIDAYGEFVPYTPEFFEVRIRCAECEVRHLREHSIRCAYCGFSIDEGERTSLFIYSEDMTDLHPETKIMLPEKGSPSLIGCLRPTCIDSLLSMAGTWAPDGYHSVRGTIETVIPLREYVSLRQGVQSLG